MTEANDVLTIDVVSDVVCPWCYLGEKRLEAALAEESRPVSIRWRPYQLDPTIPAGGLDRAEYMERKFGRDGRLKSVHDQLVRLGAEVGISFAFDRIERAPNTLDAHRLIRWAGTAGGQREVVDRLFHAYFVEGRDIGDRAVLLDVARGERPRRGRREQAPGRRRGRGRGAARDRRGAGDRRHRRAVLHFRRPRRRARRAGRRAPTPRDDAGARGDERRRRRLRRSRRSVTAASSARMHASAEVSTRGGGAYAGICGPIRDGRRGE